MQTLRNGAYDLDSSVLYGLVKPSYQLPDEVRIYTFLERVRLRTVNIPDFLNDIRSE